MSLLAGLQRQHMHAFSLKFSTNKLGSITWHTRDMIVAWLYRFSAQHLLKVAAAAQPLRKQRITGRHEEVWVDCHP